MQNHVILQERSVTLQLVVVLLKFCACYVGPLAMNVLEFTNNMRQASCITMIFVHTNTYKELVTSQRYIAYEYFWHSSVIVSYIIPLSDLTVVIHRCVWFSL